MISLWGIILSVLGIIDIPDAWEVGFPSTVVTVKVGSQIRTISFNGEGPVVTNRRWPCHQPCYLNILHLLGWDFKAAEEGGLGGELEAWQNQVCHCDHVLTFIVGTLRL